MRASLSSYEGKEVGGNSGCLAFTFILECRTCKSNLIIIPARGNRLFDSKTYMFAHLIFQ